MAISKLLSMAVALAVARASPVLDSPSQVARRDPPKPSAYPLGDPCGHEWQYLNFDPKNDVDTTHLKTLHDIICVGEVRALSSYGQFSAKHYLAPYKRHLPKSDDEDEK